MKKIFLEQKSMQELQGQVELALFWGSWQLIERLEDNSLAYESVSGEFKWKVVCYFDYRLLPHVILISLNEKIIAFFQRKKEL